MENKTENTPINYDAVLCPVFKCKCGENKFELLGTTPELDLPEGLQKEDALYTCDNCDELYYLSEINGV